MVAVGPGEGTTVPQQLSPFHPKRWMDPAAPRALVPRGAGRDMLSPRLSLEETLAGGTGLGAGTVELRVPISPGREHHAAATQSQGPVWARGTRTEVLGCPVSPEAAGETWAAPPAPLHLVLDLQDQPRPLLPSSTLLAALPADWVPLHCPLQPPAASLRHQPSGDVTRGSRRSSSQDTNPR